MLQTLSRFFSIKKLLLVLALLAVIIGGILFLRQEKESAPDLNRLSSDLSGGISCTVQLQRGDFRAQSLFSQSFIGESSLRFFSPPSLDGFEIRQRGQDEPCMEGDELRPLQSAVALPVGSRTVHADSWAAVRWIGRAADSDRTGGRLLSFDLPDSGRRQLLGRAGGADAGSSAHRMSRAGCQLYPVGFSVHLSSSPATGGETSRRRITCYVKSF